jgi:hypothetical protein
MMFGKRKNKRQNFYVSNTSTTATSVSVYSHKHDDDVEHEKCPWDLAPKNIEEFLMACDIRNLWIMTNGTEPPRYWSMILSHGLVEDICRKIISGDKK